MSGARTINYGYDNRDRLTSEDGTVYSWNENGNLVGRTGDGDVEWDFDDRLVKVTKSDGTVVENMYDVDGVLVRTAVNGVATDLLVDTSGGLSHVVAEIDGSGAVAALYVRAGDMLLEEIRGGVAKMYEADGLGSTRSLLDATGVQTDTWSYEAFGTTLASTGTSLNPYRFAGERLVEATGMYQNRARWLDTGVGRFASMDPFTGFGESPVSLHSYLYGAASPVRYVDPTGNFNLVSTAITIADIAVLGAIVGGAGVAAYSYAKGQTVTLEAVQAGMLVGAGAGIAMYAFPRVAAALGVGAGAATIMDLGPLLSDPNVSFDRKLAASVLIVTAAVGPIAGTKYAQQRALLDSIKKINVGPGFARCENCANCTVATNATLAGNPASALPGGVTSAGDLAVALGRSPGDWIPVGGVSEMQAAMGRMGWGARGAVFGVRSSGPGHFFNVVNRQGSIFFADGQNGQFASTEGFELFFFLPLD